MSANRLIHEKSPYLLQHAHNPVDWYPWGEEAFRKARSEDKPIFLSIGYSTCHWCHVMERESFEDEDTAAMLNTLFVPVKVDREERPDIDRIYMSYVQAATGGGGWPMSVWLTPELKPFVGGTYFPPDNRYGRAGFPLVLERIAEAWKNDREKILAQSATVLEQIRDAQGGADEPGAERVESALMDRAYQQLRRSFDARLGGFGGAPKFPRPSVYNFLLRYWKRTGDDEALDMVTATLIGMARGGMNDQLGGGFHRYSVDEYWFVPHFEKMLYDQAQLVVSYLEAYQITREEAFANAARRTLDYVMREMTAPEGGFWSAEDADSAPDPGRPNHKTEGAFYIWAWDEVVRLLGEERAEWFAYRYGMRRGGNVQNDPHHEFEGKNVLFEAKSVEQTAAQFGQPVEEMRAALRGVEEVLFAVRAKRVRPHLDDKILTAWNGLMISAFAKGAAILEEPRYGVAASRAAEFLLGTLRQPDGILLRRYRDGEAGIRGMLDDYAFLTQGLLDLYETSLEERYLEAAIAITRGMEELFRDPEGGGYFSSAEEDASALVKLKDDYDGAEPSGNSVALMNLLRLEQISGSEEVAGAARKLIATFQTRLGNAPHALPQMLAACEFDNAVKREIVVAGDMQQEMARELWRNFEPFRTVLRASTFVASMRPEVAAMTPPESGALVYVCQNFTCQAPAGMPEALARLLN